MRALVFDIRINSLFSIRIPFTWQSALSYPILPPSAVIGILANALQRYKNNKPPLEYLALVEDNILWAGSRLLTPCVIKSYITSSIVKWEDTLGSKFTNVLGRQYAYSRKLQIAVIFKNSTQINDAEKALKTAPLTCGDSESPFSLDGEIIQKDVVEGSKGIIKTFYPIPFTKDIKIIDGNGRVYLMHERCKKKEDNFPLISYMVPLIEEYNILSPSFLKVKVEEEKILNIKEIGDIVFKARRIDN